MNIKYLTNWKYRFFTKKIRDVEMAMLEADFKIAKSRQLREQIRQDRDRAVESARNISEKLEKSISDEEKKQLKEELTLHQENKPRFEKQMDMIDREIHGFRGTETEEPVIGILERLASMAELKQMYKEYRSGL
jgi:uncharacterized protein YllA (UPF0747 family)